METPASKVLAALARESQFMPLHEEQTAAIAKEIVGWSGATHHVFFQSVMDALPEIKSVLMLGVYHGRDFALLSDAASKTRELQLVGVDKFSDTPCDDWREGWQGKTWEQAGFGVAPNLSRAVENLKKRLPPVHQLRLIEADDAVWLPSVQGKFDFIYIDTSHDKATVLRQLAQVKPLCHANTLLAGDDYGNCEPTWGVSDAVIEAFTEHSVIADVIWFADAVALK